jgi:hypothetical protein
MSSTPNLPSSIQSTEAPSTMSEDDLLLAQILSAHHAKPRTKVVAALRADCPLTTKHKRALADRIEVLTTPRTKHDRGRKKALPYDGSKKDLYERACKEVVKIAEQLGCSQRLALEFLAGPRESDYPLWDDATRAKVRAANPGLWRARAATLSAILGKEAGDRYDWSLFSDRIAAELHLD